MADEFDRLFTAAQAKPGKAEDDYEHTDDDNPAHSQRVRAEFIVERGDHVELARHLINTLKRVDGVARDVTYCESDFWRYAPDQGIYERLPQEVIGRTLNTFSGRYAKMVKTKEVPLFINDGTVTGVSHRARDELSDPEFFEQSKPGLMFANGFVRVSTDGEVTLEPRGEVHRARHRFNHKYEQGRKPERLLEWFSQVFDGDDDAEQKIQLLREHAGACILGVATRFQQALCLHGTGRNGKSQWLALLPLMVPPGASCSIPPQRWDNEYYRAQLAGKLINVVNEMPEAEIIGSEAFKSIVSGDQTDGRHIRQSPFMFKPVAGHIFAANNLPGSADQTSGFWRRWSVVSFNRTFSDAVDKKEIWRELAKEIHDTIGWCIDGAADALRRNKLTAPPSSASEKDEWLLNSDPVRLFLHECTNPLDSERPITDGVMTTLMYQYYKRWLVHAGLKYQLGRRKFLDRMKTAGSTPNKSNGSSYYHVEMVGSEWEDEPYWRRGGSRED